MQIASLDLAILALILISALIGVVRGLVKELLSLIGWVAAFVIALYTASIVVAYIPESFGPPTLRLAMAFLAVFICVLIGSSMLQWVMSTLVESTGLSGTDRLLGLLFGSARGILIALLILMGLRSVAAEEAWWQESRLQPQLLALEDEVRDLLGRARAQAQVLVEEVGRDSEHKL
ncbi:MAG: CvpA family protein [Pseudomonadota bacterium]